jgi:hypothetical protein
MEFPNALQAICGTVSQFCQTYNPDQELAILKDIEMILGCQSDHYAEFIRCFLTSPESSEHMWITGTSNIHHVRMIGMGGFGEVHEVILFVTLSN